MTYRSGLVALAGRPNVGKSTLANALARSQVAAVSPRPQTTRRRITAVVHGDDWQAVLLDLTRLELVAVLAAVSLVLVAEMMNTAIEAAIDAVVTTYHPRVKIAKDVAAGAVLVATVNALAVAYFVFYDRLTDGSRDLLVGVRRSPTHLVVVVMILTIILVIAIKAWTGRGAPLRGGLPSGHAAAAFAGWAAITIIAEPLRHAVLVSTLAFLMALLVAQSRVEAGIHSVVETLAGAVLGTCVAIVIFQVWG